jgi:hypothetical protein
MPGLSARSDPRANGALGQQLLDVAIGQPFAQVPAHCHRDHLGRKPEDGERGPRRLRAPGARGRHAEARKVARSTGNRSGTRTAARLER